ncbi:ABC transporter permease [Paenibacillus rhizosphaerae]|nr:ABC transporter permease subunit [Paenibacillus rhizosphaerae]
MVLPAIVFLILFAYVPMWGVLSAFQEYNIYKGFWASPWVGLDQFRAFFEADEFWLVMRNTFVISLLKLFIGFPAPIVLALMFNEIRNRFFKRLSQTLTYLPHFMSWAIIGGFAASLFAVDNGSVNILLQKLGLIHEPVNWLSTPHYFWGILVSTNIWKEIGFNSIIYLAAITGIDPHLYEAAAMDGASRFKQIYRITLPCIMPVISVFLILAVGNIMNAGFEDILVLTNNGNNGILLDVADVIDTYVLRTGIGGQRYSYAAAAGLFKSLVNVVLLLLANGMVRRMGKESLW